MNDLDFDRSLPDTSSTVRVQGLGARAEIWRDAEGIPHARAASEADAFFAQGWVHAQDRLWQMEYDRRRAYGRWAELAGPAALAQDVQMRRFRLEASARADYAAASADTRVMLDAYAAGVNALHGSARTLPVEFGLVGARQGNARAGGHRHRHCRGSRCREAPGHAQRAARQQLPCRGGPRSSQPRTSQGR